MSDEAATLSERFEEWWAEYAERLIDADVPLKDRMKLAYLTGGETALKKVGEMMGYRKETETT